MLTGGRQDGRNFYNTYCFSCCDEHPSVTLSQSHAHEQQESIREFNEYPAALVATGELSTAIEIRITIDGRLERWWQLRGVVKAETGTRD